MKSPNTSDDNALRVITAVLMMLIVLFVLQMLLVEHTGVKAVLSLVLIAAMGAAIGWLVTSLRKDRDNSTGRR